jgi:hypothetical protein
MKVVFSILFASLFLFSCQNASNEKSAQEQENPNAITCERIGQVYTSYTHADLQEKFGQEELEDESREIDGVNKATTRVFPYKAEEVIVIWTDDTRNKVEKLTIWNENAPYATKEGLRVGISLRDVIKFNNFLSIDFTNFYSDISGFANIEGFNGGEIEEKYPCLGGKLDIVRLKGVDINALDDFKKKNTVNSSDPLMQSIEVKLAEISISN